MNLSKKKSSGLSKKVPAIFEGIPSIDLTARNEAADSASPTVTSGSVFQKTVRPARRLLFEVADFSVKAMAVRKESNHWKVTKIYRYLMKAEGEDRRQLDSQEFRDWLANCYNESGDSEDLSFRILLMSKSLQVSEIAAADVNAKDIKNSILWQIAEKIPFSIEEAKVLYEKKEDKYLVAALPAAFIDNALKPFHEAGIHPELMTILPLALDGLNKEQPFFSEKNVLIADLGHGHTSILIFKKGKFYSMREVSIGGEHITQAMTGVLIVDETQITVQYQEAEAMKIALGLPTADLAPENEEPKLSQLSARIRPLFEKIINEFRSCTAQFQKQFANEKIDQVYLIGGGAQMKGLDAFLSKQLNLPVQLINPKNLDPDLDISSVGLFGLVHAEMQRFNFSPMEDVWQVRLEKYKFFAKIAVFALSGIFLLAILLSGIQIMNQRLELKKLQKSYQGMSYAIQKMDEKDFLLQQILNQKNILRQNIKQDPRMGAVLREVSHLTLPFMRVSKMEYKKDPQPYIELTGSVQQSSSSPDLVLSQFLERLNQSPFFKQAVLASRDAPQVDRGRLSVGFLIRAPLVLPKES